MWNIAVPSEQQSITSPAKKLTGPAAMDIALNTVEQMAFMPTSDSVTHIARIKIITPVKGELMLFINSNLAIALTRSINGIPETEKMTDKTRIVDAVAEVLNIIAGQFMKSLLPVDGDFSLGLPVTSMEKQLRIPSGIILRFYEINNMSISIGIKGKELIDLFNT